MTTAEQRRLAAMDAIRVVLAGTRAEAAETDLVDFKVEEGSVGGGGRPIAIGPRHEAAAAALAEAAACMANTVTGGILVVGVKDDRAGVGALTGAVSDAAWLRERIWALTQPGLVVDVEEVIEQGARLLLVNVPDQLEEIRHNGRLRTRIGARCVDLSGDRARQFLEERRGYDWSAQPSGLRLSHATPEALASARRHYTEEHGNAPGSDRELVRRLGLLVDDDPEDPAFNRAGALLLCPFEPGVERLRLLVTRAEGSASHAGTPPLAAPLLPAFDQVMTKLLDAFSSTRKVVGTQRVLLRPIPETVVREALVNAVMHRDHRLDRAAIIALAIGDPPGVLKVRSPGGLPAGVSVDRLIAAPSRPRNPVLAEAMRVLGLAEREGVGIDTMYRLMLQDGHAVPEIVEADGEVVVRLQGGEPDVSVRGFFDVIGSRVPALRDSTLAAIAVSALLSQRVLRAEDLAVAGQATPADAATVLADLEKAGAVSRLLNGALAFRLSDEGRRSLAGRIRYRTPIAIEQHEDLVLAYLDSHPEISSAAASDLLDISLVRASQVLGALVKRGTIRRATDQRRGPGVRYVRA